MKKSILLLFICFGSANIFAQNINYSYLFLGHIAERVNPGNTIDSRILLLDLDNFDGIWLGGDVCTEASLNYATLEYINDAFDLSNPETFWALGNHDARDYNWDWISELTGRNTYYTHHFNGLTAIVMNTNIVPTQCEMLNEQYKIISNVCDTIQNSSCLFLIMHHGLFRDIPNIPNPNTYAHSDLIYWNANCDGTENTFAYAIYPKLIEVKNRGIEVYCIMGDMGATKSVFNMVSEHGIHFIGNGIHDKPGDKVMFINWDYTHKILDYEFHDLDSLVSVK